MEALTSFFPKEESEAEMFWDKTAFSQDLDGNASDGTTFVMDTDDFSELLGKPLFLLHISDLGEPPIFQVDPQRITGKKSWQLTFLEKIREISNLPMNWDGSEAPSPNQFAIRNAQEILGLLHFKSFPPYSIIPNVNGGINLSFFKNGRRAFIKCSNENEIICATYGDLKETEIWEIGVSMDEIQEAIEKINTFIHG